MAERSESLGRRVFSGGITMLFTQGVTIVLYFLAQRVILSTLTKEENGELFAVRRVADLILILLVDFGLNGVSMRRVIQQPEHAREILSSTLAFKLMMWVVATLLCFGYAQFAHLSIVDVVLWCLFLLLTSRSGMLRYTMELPYRAHVRFGFVNGLAIVDAFVFVGLVMLWKDALTPSTVIVAYMCSTLPGFLTLLAMDKGRNFRPRWVSRAMMKSLVIDALPVLILVILTNIHDKIDGMMLERFSTPREMGIFSAAYQTLVPLTGTIPMAITMSLVPAVAHLAKENWEECRRFALTGLRIIILAGIAVSTVTSAAAPFIIDVVSKGRYADNLIHFVTFLWMPLPIFVLVFVQELMVAMGHQRRALPIAISLAVTTIATGLVLIPEWNAYGAVLSKLAAVGVSSIVSYVLLHRVLGESLTLSAPFRIVIVTAVCCTVAVMAPEHLGIALGTLLSTAVFVVMAIVTGLITRADVGMVRRLLQSRASA